MECRSRGWSARLRKISPAFRRAGSSWSYLSRALANRGSMNYQAFTKDSLTMMYEGIRGALAADDVLKNQGGETRFRVRETPDWKKHAADLEGEMLNRG